MNKYQCTIIVQGDKEPVQLFTERVEAMMQQLMLPINYSKVLNIEPVQMLINPKTLNKEAFLQWTIKDGE